MLWLHEAGASSFNKMKSERPASKPDSQLHIYDCSLLMVTCPMFQILLGIGHIMSDNIEWQETIEDRVRVISFVEIVDTFTDDVIN